MCVAKISCNKINLNKKRDWLPEYEQKNITCNKYNKIFLEIKINTKNHTYNKNIKIFLKIKINLSIMQDKIKISVTCVSKY